MGEKNPLAFLYKQYLKYITDEALTPIVTVGEGALKKVTKVT